MSLIFLTENGGYSNQSQGGARGPRFSSHGYRGQSTFSVVFCNYIFISGDLISLLLFYDFQVLLE